MIESNDLPGIFLQEQPSLIWFTKQLVNMATERRTEHYCTCMVSDYPDKKRRHFFGRIRLKKKKIPSVSTVFLMQACRLHQQSLQQMHDYLLYLLCLDI